MGATGVGRATPVSVTRLSAGEERRIVFRFANRAYRLRTSTLTMPTFGDRCQQRSTTATNGPCARSWMPVGAASPVSTASSVFTFDAARCTISCGTRAWPLQRGVSGEGDMGRMIPYGAILGLATALVASGDAWGQVFPAATPRAMDASKSAEP